MKILVVVLNYYLASRLWSEPRRQVAHLALIKSGLPLIFLNYFPFLSQPLCLLFIGFLFSLLGIGNDMADIDLLLSAYEIYCHVLCTVFANCACIVEGSWTCKFINDVIYEQTWNFFKIYLYFKILHITILIKLRKKIVCI